MQYPERFVLEGSERQLPEGHTQVGDVDPDERATVTVHVQEGPEGPDTVREFAASFHLSVDSADPAGVILTLSGRLDDLQRAFGTSLGVYVDGAGRRYRGRTGPLEPPLALEGVVTGVFGLDEGP